MTCNEREEGGAYQVAVDVEMAFGPSESVAAESAESQS
jgi:hypothetical protein